MEEFMKRIIARLSLAATLALGAVSPLAAAGTETALFAGGCFWCVESDMDSVDGVKSTISGYAGGHTENPTYHDYNEGGHREVVKVEFDPAKISYGKLVSTFLRTIDVTDDGGQFCDRGHAYTTAIYALDDEQAKQAKQAIAEAEKSLGRDIVTPVEGPARFWPAEDYHQNYYRSQVRTLTRFGYVTRASAYKGYRKGCGRDARVRAVWGDQAYMGVHHGS
jgi:peptide-methionine (S)-S-oxide reductase